MKKNSELIGFVYADMATPPEAFYDLIENAGNVDGVIANRWDKRSKITSRAFHRKILSKGFNMIASFLFFFSSCKENTSI